MEQPPQKTPLYIPVERHFPVSATQSLLSGKYKPLLLWKLGMGTLRFSQLRRAVPCATPKMLTQQLREMEADGLVRREIFPVIPPKVEYSLTDFGRSLCPVLEAMHAWGGTYLARQGTDAEQDNAGAQGDMAFHTSALFPGIDQTPP